jgi:hypothetical protein
MQLNAAQYSSMQLNAAQCSSIQLNPAQSSSIQLNELTPAPSSPKALSTQPILTPPQWPQALQPCPESIGQHR